MKKVILPLLLCLLLPDCHHADVDIEKVGDEVVDGKALTHPGFPH